MKQRKQPPIDNAHVAPGCEPFVTANDYQPTTPLRLCIRRVLTKFASTDAKLTDCENEIIECMGAQLDTGFIIGVKRNHAKKP